MSAIIEGDEDKNFPAEEVYVRAEDVLVTRCARERVHAREKRESTGEGESFFILMTCRSFKFISMKACEKIYWYLWDKYLCSNPSYNPFMSLKEELELMPELYRRMYNRVSHKNKPLY